MIDENTPKPDETPTVPPPAEPAGATRDAAPPSLPPADAPPEPAPESPPATEPAAEMSPVEPPAEPADSAPVAADVVGGGVAETHEPAESATTEAVEAEAAPAEVGDVAEADAAAPEVAEGEVAGDEVTGAEAEPPAAEAPESAEPTGPAEEPKAKPKKPRKSAKAAAVEDEAEPAATATAEPAAEPAAESKKRWYAVKVQSGREESIKAAIERKVKIENLEPYFGQIVIPVEEVNEKKKVRVKVKDKKTGEVETTTQERNVVKKIKKFQGYIFAEVEFNDEILYVFRETSGVGDFVGIPARRGQGGERLAPAPMTDAEVQSMLTGVPVPGGPSRGKAKTVVKLDFEKGDKVRIKNGAFAGHEAEVKAITEAKDPTDSPKVTVIVTMWGRPVDVDLDYWEVDKA